MILLQQIEDDLKETLKRRDRLAADTLRGLKARMQNEAVAKMRPLTDDEGVSLVKSEIKRRRESAESFSLGGRQESADKEIAESEILAKYLPEQMSEQQIAAQIDRVVSDMVASKADFGKVMGRLKTEIGQKADGAVMARLLKDRLK